MATMATIHPDMRVLVEARAAAGDKGDEVEAARRFWTAYTNALAEPPPDDMAVHDSAAPGAGGDVPLRVYRPAGGAGVRPCILYLHGGGFMLGDLDSSD